VSQQANAFPSEKARLETLLNWLNCQNRKKKGENIFRRDFMRENIRNIKNRLQRIS